MSTTQSSLAEASTITVRLLLAIVGLGIAIGGPITMGSLSLIRSIDGLKVEVSGLRSTLVRQGETLSRTVTEHDFRSWLREARATGVALPDFASD